MQQLLQELHGKAREQCPRRRAVGWKLGSHCFSGAASSTSCGWGAAGRTRHLQHQQIRVGELQLGLLGRKPQRKLLQCTHPSLVGQPDHTTHASP